MDERLESWIAAERLIVEHGERAGRVAAGRAEDSRARGDSAAADMWTQIGASIREIQAGRNAPGPAA